MRSSLFTVSLLLASSVGVAGDDVTKIIPRVVNIDKGGVLAQKEAAAAPPAKGPATPASGTPVLAPVPFQGQPVASASPGTATTPGTAIKLSGTEFELLTLSSYAGPVTWDVTTPDGSNPPISWFECDPKSTIIGLRASQTEPAKYVTPETPTLAIYCKGKGRAVISAWGVVDMKPVKLAQKMVEASVETGPVTPADELIGKVQAAYAADTSATKAADKTALAAVYTATIDALDNVVTASDVFDVLKGATENRVAGRLKPIRALLGAELSKILTDEGKTPVTALQKEAVAKLLKRMADILNSETK